MTYYKYVEINCDKCSKLYTGDGMCSTATELRDMGRDDGWVYREGEDYCPDCK